MYSFDNRYYKKCLLHCPFIQNKTSKLDLSSIMLKFYVLLFCIWSQWGCRITSGKNITLFSVRAGVKKLANKAALWYVPCSLQNVDKILEVPPPKVTSELGHLDILWNKVASLTSPPFSSLSLKMQFVKISRRPPDSMFSISGYCQACLLNKWRCKMAAYKEWDPINTLINVYISSMLGFYQYKNQTSNRIFSHWTFKWDRTGSRSLTETPVGDCTHSSSISCFLFLSKVCQLRAGGGGQEALRGSEDREAGDQSQDRRGCSSSLQPRWHGRRSNIAARANAQKTEPSLPRVERKTATWNPSPHLLNVLMSLCKMPPWCLQIG